MSVRIASSDCSQAKKSPAGPVNTT